MRIAIPVCEDRATISLSFGRAPYFCVVDMHSGDKSILENAAAKGSGGAGLRAAQAVLDIKVDALIAPKLGANAARRLKAAGVKVFAPKFDGVQANVGALLAGSLKATAVHSAAAGTTSEDCIP
jgi:predicted Fe-Mo cluster-binding NifX family protein